MRLYNVDIKSISGVIISSVVPPVTRNIISAVKSLTGITPLIVEQGLKTGLNIKIEDSSSLGSDLVCGAVAAKTLYKCPCIAIDLGTVTKIMALDSSGTLIGGVLAPGVGASFEMMASKTALLPLVGAETPGKVIGTNTAECIKSGVLYGTACMLDGFIEKFEVELRQECTVVATGGFSELIVSYCKRKPELNRWLVSEGLRIIYEKNR
jgi:type III pantothenate kinase